MNRTRQPESSLSQLAGPPDVRREDARIAAELVALGEAEPDALEMIPAAAEADDVAVVIALFGLAHGAGPELSPLERRRVWRRLETVHGHADPDAAPKRGGGLWIGLAAAAALVLVPFFAPEQMKRTSDPDAHATLLAMGQQAKRTLGDMPGGQDQVRARALADDYAARLHGAANSDAPTGGTR